MRGTFFARRRLGCGGDRASPPEGSSRNGPRPCILDTWGAHLEVPHERARAALGAERVVGVGADVGRAVRPQRYRAADAAIHPVLRVLHGLNPTTTQSPKHPGSFPPAFARGLHQPSGQVAGRSWTSLAPLVGARSGDGARTTQEYQSIAIEAGLVSTCV